MQVQVAKDPSEWNAIVDKSPFSVLHHRYEACVYEDKALPLIVRNQTHCFLFPIRILSLMKSFRLAISPIYYYASIIPDSEDSVNLIGEALDSIVNFLHKTGVDYLSTCPSSFLSKRYASGIDSWFREHDASVQTLFLHMIPTKGRNFEEIWNSRFSKRARNRIRKSKKIGLRILKIDSAEGISKWREDIYQCNLSGLRRQGRIGAYPDSYPEVFLSELISTKNNLGENFNIFAALFKGRLGAYVAVGECGRLMQVTKAMSHTKFLHAQPNEALVSHLIEEACSRKIHWFEYGFDRVRRNGKTPTLYPSLQQFKFKFGFEEIPVPIYRIGLTKAGRLLQHLYSVRESLIIKSAYIPENQREFLLRIYRPRHRKFFALSQV